RFQGFRIGRLYADLKLDETRTHPADQFQLILPEKIRRYLEMKVGNAVVMLQNILPDLHGVFMPAVKSTVHKFHLGDSVIQEKLQFLFYQTETAEPEFPVDGGKTVAAGKRASPAALIVYDPVLKIFRIFIDKGDPVKINRFPEPVVNDRVFFPEDNPG